MFGNILETLAKVINSHENDIRFADISAQNNFFTHLYIKN